MVKYLAIVVALWIALEALTDYNGPLSSVQFAGLPLQVWVVFTAPIAGLALLGLLAMGLGHVFMFFRRKNKSGH